MTEKQAKEYMVNHARDWLRPDRSGRGYICPICGSGTGAKGTGITTKDGIHFTCWVGCFQSADILDIIGKKEGAGDFPEKLKAAAAAFGITLDGTGKGKKAPADRNGTSYTAERPEADYTAFFREAEKNIDATDYHRGLKRETLKRFGIGFVPAWTHPKIPGSPPSPRLIIPTGKGSYLARDTRKELTPEQKRYSKSKVGRVRIFNADALRQNKKPVFIVEGEIDALSVIDAGGEAVALGSVSNRKLLLDMLKEKKPSVPLIVAMDNDEAGRKASSELCNDLYLLDVAFCEENISAPYKDANEALEADRGLFEAAIAVGENIAEEEAEEKRDRERRALQKESAAGLIDGFFAEIEKGKQGDCIPTGWEELDRILDGGLIAELYVVGAVSSLGKTTFCLQIADAIAKGGTDVLIFSLEMSGNELIAKSISRLTYLLDREKYGSRMHAKTARDILNGARYEGYGETERTLIREAAEAYRAYAENLYIHEGSGDIGVSEIRERVGKHIRITGRAPVVIVDYLQILAPADVRATDKQNTDKAVLELKRMSRDFKIPVIGISSFNRDNYLSPVNMASFKESGSIEYSAGLLLGLQALGMDYQEGESEKLREKRIRALSGRLEEAGRTGNAQVIQVKILKNRNGSRGEVILDFYPMFNYFAPHEEKRQEPDGWHKSTSRYEQE